MKRTTAIVTLAIGLTILFSSTLKANTTASFNEVSKTTITEISHESEIIVQDWMLRFDSAPEAAEKAAEKEISLEFWMINPEWNDNSEQMITETEIELEDWMTRSFVEENWVIAQQVPIL